MGLHQMTTAWVWPVIYSTQLERVQQSYPNVRGMGILNKNISMDQWAKAWKQKAQDPNMQITAEMLGAQASTKRVKVGVNSKP